MKLKNKSLKLEKKCSKIKQWNKKNLIKIQTPEELMLKYLVSDYILMEMSILKNYLKLKRKSNTFPKKLVLCLLS